MRLSPAFALIFGLTLAIAAPGQLVGRTYTPRQIRAVDFYGARLGMRLEEARAALTSRGLMRQPYRQQGAPQWRAQVLEADYRSPHENTKVGLFYTITPQGERRVSRLLLWEQIEPRHSTTFSNYAAARYGQPTARPTFQNSIVYLWSQQPAHYPILLRSMQCMMECLPRDLLGQCSERTVSRQVFMTGRFNTNMPGRLYWFAELNDLELQRSGAFGPRSSPISRRQPICLEPVA